MITQPIVTKQLSADGFRWNQFSPRVGTITNELTDFAPVAYFQFANREEAQAFWKSLTDKRYCTRAQIREAERFTSGFEVKVWGIQLTILQKLIERDRSRAPQKLPLPPIRRIAA